MKKHEKFVDDGRTIANMNVEGMPWYNPSRGEEKKSAPLKDLTRGETWAILWGILKAAMLVVLVFAVVFTLFILFTYYVWLK